MGFINYLTNGVSLGSVYAVIALGYAMVYGIARMLNFAHGDVIMIGSYVVLITVSTIGFLPMVGVLVAVLACMLLGMIIEWIAYKPLCGASLLAVLTMAIGVSYLLQDVALLIFGMDTRSFTPAVTIPIIKPTGGQMTITGETIVTIPSCIVIMIGLATFINKPKAGQAILAVSEDRGTTTLVRININGTIVPTFAIGSVLAAVADMLLCSAYPSLIPYIGSMLGIKASVAAVFDDIGSIPDAFTGGVFLGVIEILAKAHIPSQMSDVIVFSVLIIVLLVKPTGILDKRINEKVQVPV